MLFSLNEKVRINVQKHKQQAKTFNIHSKFEFIVEFIDSQRFIEIINFSEIDVNLTINDAKNESKIQNETIINIQISFDFIKRIKKKMKNDESIEIKRRKFREKRQNKKKIFREKFSNMTRILKRIVNIFENFNISFSRKFNVNDSNVANLKQLTKQINNFEIDVTNTKKIVKNINDKLNKMTNNQKQFQIRLMTILQQRIE